MGKISYNVFKKVFATWQHAFLSTCIAFMAFLIGHAEKSKFCVFRRESYLSMSLGFLFFCFYLFFRLSFFSFLFFSSQWLTFYWAFFPFQNIWDSIIETGNFCHGVATTAGRKFFSEFFTQISEHLCAYFMLHWADHSDLGIIRKTFFSTAEVEHRWCQYCSKVMTSEVEQRPRLLTGGYRRNGVNGLIEVRYSNIYKAYKINFECEFYEGNVTCFQSVLDKSLRDCNTNIYPQWKTFSYFSQWMWVQFLPCVDYNYLLLGTNGSTIIFTNIEIQQPNWKLINYMYKWV